MSDNEQVALNEGADLAQQFEGYSSKPYRDPTGTWTIGYGSTRDVHGNAVTAHTPPITQALAHGLMMRDLGSAFLTVESAVTQPLTVNEEAALMDFVYNVGAGNFRSSTLLRLLNDGNYDAAAAEFAKWDLSKGRVLAGLVRRRAAEKALFEKS